MVTNPPSDADCGAHHPRQITRRTALTTAAAGLAGLAGCLGFGNNTTPTGKATSENTSGGTDATATSAYSLPPYTKWAYPQGARDAKSSYITRRFDPQTIFANEQAVRSGLVSVTENLMGDLTTYLGDAAAVDEVGTLVTVDGNRIYGGPWSQSAMADSITAFKDIQDAGTLEGYQLYTHPRAPEAMAITEGKFLTGRFLEKEEPALETPLDVVKLLINTYTGASDRFGASSSDFKQLMGGAGGGYYNHGYVRTSPYQETDYKFNGLKGVHMEQLRYELADGQTKASIRLLYASADAASKQAVKQFSKKARLFNEWTVESVTRKSDRLFTITGTIE